jgi:1-acyl-sn-glycerol-3-phosphate acyltransferase
MQVGGAAAYIDLERNVRTLEGLADWWGKEPTSPNPARIAKYLQYPLRQVKEAIDAAPGEFIDATDLLTGQTKIQSAMDHLVATAATPLTTAGKIDHVTSAADDVRQAHALLGRTREVPELSPAIPDGGLPEFAVAPADHPIVRAKVGGWQLAGRAIMKGIAGPIVGLKVYGKNNIPSEGAALLTPTHCGHYDPAHLLGGVSRTVRFLANQKLWANPIQGWAMSSAGAIKLEQGNAENGLSILRAVLREQKLGAMYPEGMIVRGQFLGPHGDGAAEVALQMNVPIVPSATAGPKHILADGDPGGRKLRSMVYGEAIRPNGAPATEDNILLLREKNARAQDSLFTQMQDDYMSRRVASKARKKYWLAGSGVAVAGVAAVDIKRNGA